MIIALDASAAVEVVLNREKAPGFADRIGRADWVISPELFVAEVSNTFWKYHALGAMPVDKCEGCLEQAVALPDDLVRMEVMAREALSMACRTGITAYDAFYLVLARRNDALLLSCDNRLNEAAAKESIRLPGDE